MALIDDLKEVLGEEAIEKIKAKGIDARINRGDEVLSYLDKGEIPPDNKPVVQGLSLEDLTKTLKTSLTDFESTFTPKINAIADERAKALLAEEGKKFHSTILADAIKLSHQTARIEREHEKVFGEQLDLDKLDEFVKTSGRQFSSPQEAWNEWTREKRTEKLIEEKAEEKYKAKLSSQSVPGVSPASSTGVRASLRAFGKATNSEGKTRAEVLNDKLAALERAS